MKFEVKDHSRLDKALRDAGQLSVKRAKLLIQGGSLFINGHLVKKPSFLVRPGDRVDCREELLPPSPVESLPVEEKKSEDLEVLFEDEYLVVVNKPPGLLSVPTSHSTEASALSRVEKYLSQKSPKSFAYAVHRLDRAVSGVLIFAKGVAEKEAMMSRFKAREVKKTYLAILQLSQGFIAEDRLQGKIDIAIDDNRPHSKVIPHAGKPAMTQYKVISQCQGHALIHAYPKTGRRHQVRVHLALALAPIAGDQFYGEKNKEEDKRLFLHCEQMELNHPHGGQSVKIRAAIPEDFSKKLATLGLRV